MGRHLPSIAFNELADSDLSTEQKVARFDAAMASQRRVEHLRRDRANRKRVRQGGWCRRAAPSRLVDEAFRDLHAAVKQRMADPRCQPGNRSYDAAVSDLKWRETRRRHLRFRRIAVGSAIHGRRRPQWLTRGQHRRAPGRQAVHRSGSRRSSAPTRGSPSPGSDPDESDPPSHSPRRGSVCAAQGGAR
jgi:hypothetical protein